MLSTKAELRPLTKQAVQNLYAIAGDPIDGMRLAADVYTANAYLAERALAIETGKPRPKAPKPQSKFLRSLENELKARLVQIAERLTPHERARLDAVGVALNEHAEADAGFVAIVLLLTVLHPVDAAGWIRAHLDEIETRVAS